MMDGSAPSSFNRQPKLRAAFGGFIGACESAPLDELTRLAYRTGSAEMLSDVARQTVAVAPDDTHLAWLVEPFLVVLAELSDLRNVRYKLGFGQYGSALSGAKAMHIRCNGRIGALTFGYAPVDDSVSGLCFRQNTPHRKALLLAIGLENGRIQIHSADTGRLLIKLLDHVAAIRGIVISPYVLSKRSALLSCSVDSTLKLWDLRDNGNMYKTLKGHGAGDAALCCAWSPDGRWIASGGTDSKVIIWNAIAPYRHYKLELHKNYVTSCDFSPDSTKLVSCSRDTTAVIWDFMKRLPVIALRHQVPTPRSVFSFSVNKHNVLDVAFSPDGKYIATMCSDRQLRVWLVKQPDKPIHVQSVDCGQSVTYSADGTAIAVCTTEGSLRIYSAPMMVSRLRDICQIVLRRKYEWADLAVMCGSRYYRNLLEFGEQLTAKSSTHPAIVFNDNRLRHGFS